MSREEGLRDRAVAHLRAVADLPDLSGTRYTLIGEIARGGMGTVYRARDAELDRDVALKVVGPPDASGDLSSRLRLEARLLARLEHPNLVPVHDAGTLPDGRVFYVMKLVRGMRLDGWMQQAPGRTAALRLFRKICEAVAFAHAQGVVHRDLKPENIMVGAFGEALVMDWGVAKVLAPDGGGPVTASGPNGMAEPSPVAGAKLGSRTSVPASPIASGPTTAPLGVTERGTVIGTPGYMAPEQARGETDRVDGRADIYALGGILFFLLHGRAPRPASGAERPGRAREAQGVEPGLSRGAGDMPRALDSIRIKAMAADPSDRYATALDLAADVDRYLDALPVHAHRESLLERTGRLLSRNRTLVGLVLAYLLMRLVMILVYGR